MPITKSELRSLRHPSERSRFLLSAFVLAPVAVLLAGIIMWSEGVALIAIPVILVTLWFSLKIFHAWYANNTVRATPQSFPEVVEAIDEARELFGYKGQVDAFIFESGSFNAALVPLLQRKFLLINSDILSSHNGRDEVRFLVGRFVGALASRHFRWSWLQFFLSSVERLAVLNILLYPYERSIQYSGDQMGLYMIGGDIRAATLAMMKLVVGSEIAERADPGSFMAQSKEVQGSFFRWLVCAISRFPHTTNRVENLIRFAMERYPEKTAPFVDRLARQVEIRPVAGLAA